MYTIASLYDLRRHFGLAASDTSEDARLLEALRAASTQIERAAGRHFLPWRATLAHTAGIRRNELLLNDDLLVLMALEDASGAISLDAIDSLPSRGAASVLRLKNGHAFTPGDGGIAVTGVWGWHDDWLGAWRYSNDGVQDDPLDPTANVIRVQDADGEDSAHEAPRFQVGQLIAVDQEWMRVTRVDSVSSEIYVFRAVAGTDSVEHPRFSSIMVYQPARDVRDLTMRWAAWLYKQGSPVPDEYLRAIALLRRERV